MDIARISELGLGLEHRHSDGAWRLEARSHHSPSDHDPERDWASGTIYKCTTCDEEIIVEQDDTSTLRP
jgi:hypothetical protein